MHSIIMWIPPLLYALIALIHLFWVLNSKSCKVMIKARFPLTIIISILGNVYVSSILWINMLIGGLDCHMITLAKYTIFTSGFPTLTRSFHYFVFYNGLQTQYSFIIKEGNLVSLNFGFYALHYSIMEVFYWNQEFYRYGNCSMSWDAVYLGFLTILILSAGLALLISIPFRYDYFMIASELKVSLFLWTFFGIAAIITEICGNFIKFYFEPHLASIFVLTMNVCLMIVSFSPLYLKKHQQRASMAPAPVSILHTIPMCTIEEARESLSSNKRIVHISQSELYKLFWYTNIKGALYDLCRRNFCIEIALFLDAVYEYEFSSSVTTHQENFRAFKYILRTFILKGAVHEVGCFEDGDVKSLATYIYRKHAFYNLSCVQQKTIFQRLTHQAEEIIYFNFHEECQILYKRVLGEKEKSAAEREYHLP